MKHLLVLGVTGAVLLSTLGTAFAAGPGMVRGGFAGQRQKTPPRIVVVQGAPTHPVRFVGGERRQHCGKRHQMKRATWKGQGHRHHDKANRGNCDCRH